MVLKISPVVYAKNQGDGRMFAVSAIDLERMGKLSAPLEMLDNFRVSGAPFGPHPHAGFSAVTYVFEDSKTGLRSRDSLGNDLHIAPGGLVWLQAARGAQHHEFPIVHDEELHGAQIYVNLSAANKLADPATYWLQPDDVPVWSNEDGDRVRVLVGDFGGVVSPLHPLEPYTILDAHLATGVTVPLRNTDNLVIYAIAGSLGVAADGWLVQLNGGSAVALSGASEVRIAARGSSHALLLSGPASSEPVYRHGPFIMSDAEQVNDAIARYQSGQMGRLDPI